MIIERMSMSVSARQRQQMGRALASLAGPTHVQPGCLSCRLFRDWQHADKLLMEANWATAEDLVRHLRSRAYKQLLLLMELSSTPPVLQFYTVQEVRGLDLVQEVRDSPG